MGLRLLRFSCSLKFGGSALSFHCETHATGVPVQGRCLGRHRVTWPTDLGLRVKSVAFSESRVLDLWAEALKSFSPKSPFGAWAWGSCS